jgi:hypothetical protein
MSKSLDLAKVREALSGKRLLGFDTSSAEVQGLQKLSNAKIGAKPPAVLPDDDQRD